MYSNLPFFYILFYRVIGYFRQEFFIVFKFWLVGVALSVVVSLFIVISLWHSAAKEQMTLDDCRVVCVNAKKCFVCLLIVASRSILIAISLIL